MKIIVSKLLSFRLTQRLDETTAQRQLDMPFSPISLVLDIFSSIFLRNTTPTTRGHSNCKKKNRIFVIDYYYGTTQACTWIKKSTVCIGKQKHKNFRITKYLLAKSNNFWFLSPPPPPPLPPLPSRHNIFRWLYVARINDFPFSRWRTKVCRDPCSGLAATFARNFKIPQQPIRNTARIFVTFQQSPRARVQFCLSLSVTQC